MKTRGRAAGTVLMLLFFASTLSCSRDSPNDGDDSSKDRTIPVKVIFETDFTFDVDDVGALAVLHALADLGEAELLAVSYNEVQSRAADAIDAINTWYGRGDIPIGLYDKPLEEPDFFHAPYVDALAGMANNPLDNIVDSSVNVYRSILEAQPDHSVTIISVGFLNNLYDLLQEDPDLVEQKVEKLVLMGGVAYDDFNFVRHGLVDSTEYVLEHWPTPIVISQEGVHIRTGAALEATPVENPVRRAYFEWFDGSLEDRSSWDQVAVLYSVRGASEYFEKVASGSGRLANGYRWRMEPGWRMYLSHKLSTSEMAQIIEELMVRPPANQN